MAGNPLLALAVEPPDIAGNFIAGQKDAQTQRASRLSSLIDQFKLQQAQSTEAKQNQLEQLYQQNGPGIASGDENALGQLAKIDPNAAIKAKGELATQATQKATADKSKFDLMKEQVTLAGSGAQSILQAPAEFRPMLWSNLKQKLKSAGGFEPVGMPEEYSDAAIQQLANMSMSAKDQLDQHEKDRQFNAGEADKAATLAETTRANKARETQAAAQLAESTRHNKTAELAANPFGAAAPAGAFSPNGQVAAPKLTGDAFLQTLPDALQGQVKMLAEGKLAIPSGQALRTPYWQQLLQAANQYDPSLDQASAPARFKTRAAFSAGGKEATTINNLNTAIGHAGTLLDQIPGTAGHSGFPFATTANAVQNSWNTREGNPGVPLFKDTAGKLAQELTAVYRGSGGAEKEVVRGLESLDENASTETKKAILQNAVDLLSSKMDALGEQYNRGMGTTKDPLELINPHAAETFRKLQNLSTPQTSASANTAPPAAIQHLKQNPSLAPDFDAKYGQGAAKKALGQ